MASGEGKGLGCLHWLLLLAATAGPTAVVLLCLSDLPYGYGLEVYNAVAQKAYSFAGDLVISGSAALLCLYYVLGISGWEPCRQVMAFSLPCLGFAVASLLKARRYAFAPMLFVMSLMVLLLFLIRRNVCKNVRRESFYLAVAVLCASCAAAALGTEVHFVSSGNAWNTAKELRMAQEMPNVFEYVGKYKLGRPLNCTEDCGIGGDQKIALRQETQAKIAKACNKARNVLAIVWASPLIACFANIAVCMFAISHLYVHSVDATASEQIIKDFLRAYTFLLALILVTLYMNNLSELLMNATLVCAVFGLAVTMAWAYWELDLSAIQREVEHSEYMNMMIGAKESNWVRAMAVGSGFVPAFLSLEFLRRCCRRATTSVEDSGSEEEENEDEDEFPIISNLYNYILTWNWTDILLKICLLGEAFFTLQVGFSKLTSIFLSWMNVQLSGMDFTTLNVIMSGVGFFMFLCPAVPGAAVYLFIGLVDGVQASEGHPYTKNFVKGCATAVGVSAITKMAACIGQYGIGFSLSRSTKVKQAVGVTSVQIRAMEEILKTPGMAVGKVAVLVCGPDWPVSVMCGIFRLNIPQMLLGTTPVILVSIVPTVLAGAFKGVLVPGEESILGPLATCFIMAAGLLQAGGTLLMMNAVTSVVSEKGDELTAHRPEDEDVEELDKEQEQYMMHYRMVNAWENLPCCQKYTLIAAAALMLLHGAIVLSSGSLCFQKFEVSGKITNHIDDNGLGCPEATLSCAMRNIFIWPGGQVVIGIFAFAVVLHVVSDQMLTHRATQDYEALE